MEITVDKSNRTLSVGAMLKAQWRIIVALMLHDIRSRMGGKTFGFFAMGVGWPLSHILLLILVYAGLGRAAPYGDSAALWFATGVVPFMVFNYMSRWIMIGIVVNRSLLSFPVVKATDILFARALVEVLNGGLVILIIFIVFWALGIDFMPLDVVQASLALLAMMFFGLAWGFVNAIIAAALPLWMTGFFLVQVVLWMTSGILFVPDALPEVARIPLSYMPPLQGVEWMRSAYYEGYGAGILDKTYLIAFTMIILFIGLALERLVRGRILQ
jgi:capsular polysaccharide transport system permease protein